MRAQRVLLALDDTDSRSGGCTTHTALAVLNEAGLTLRGMPRLVRLNPDCPHKTRGNGAVVLPLATPDGPRVQVGSWQGTPIWAYPDGGRPDVDEDAVWQAVERRAHKQASPGMALVDAPLLQATYWQAVQSELPIDVARGLLPEARGGRGIVGCAGALAWPGPPSSYEWIGYRQADRWGTPRVHRDGPLVALDDVTTFHSGDGGRAICVPRSPCPVLVGLRGWDPEALVDAAPRAVAQAFDERVDGWAVWATNQASDDHVVQVAGLGEAPPWSTVSLTATVAARPTTRPGGHVTVALRADVDFEAVAFEPTGALRDGVRSLQPGDEVRVVGALGDGAMRLAKLHVLAGQRKVANPVCCDKSMKSMGRGGGFRCSRCRRRADPDAGHVVARPEAVWEAAPDARRHLHRPVNAPARIS